MDDGKQETAGPRLRAVVFDLDGLMFNTEELYEEVGDQLLRRRGKRVTQSLLDEMMGRPSRIALQIMIDRNDLNATVAELEAESDALFVNLLETRLAPMPGLLELLDALEQGGIPKGIATSSRRSFVDGVLGRFGFGPRFHVILSSDDVVLGKPHPEVYLTAAARFGLAPRNVLVLEDSEIGCRAAVAANAYTIAVPGEHSRGHDFSGVELVAEGLSDRRIYDALRLAPRQG